MRWSQCSGRSLGSTNVVRRDRGSAKYGRPRPPQRDRKRDRRTCRISQGRGSGIFSSAFMSCDSSKAPTSSSCCICASSSCCSVRSRHSGGGCPKLPGKGRPSIKMYPPSTCPSTHMPPTICAYVGKFWYITDPVSSPMCSGSASSCPSADPAKSTGTRNGTAAPRSEGKARLNSTTASPSYPSLSLITENLRNSYGGALSKSPSVVSNASVHGPGQQPVSLSGSASCAPAPSNEQQATSRAGMGEPPCPMRFKSVHVTVRFCERWRIWQAKLTVPTDVPPRRHLKVSCTDIGPHAKVARFTAASPKGCSDPRPKH
mmetsp:Transcript_26263/g.79145  ORF Transcript_26263/g.79145 Transcript_26263/m.79145 type:complete len:316 (-) Transcript_26263:363-1310(-)